jgi:hypothetical protein
MDQKRWFQSKIFWTGMVALVTSVGAVVMGEVSFGDAIVPMITSAATVIFRLFFSNTNLTT